MEVVTKHFTWLAYDLLYLRDKLTHNQLTVHTVHEKIWKYERYYPVKTRTQGVYYAMNKQQLVKLINNVVDDISRYY